MRVREFVCLLTFILLFSACSSGGAGQQPDFGVNLAITTRDASSILGSVSMAAETCTDIPVSDVSFRGSELTFYAIDSDSVDIIKNDHTSYQTAFDSISATQVMMPLPDKLKTVTFSRFSNSSLPIEQVGNFKNLNYNLININVGGGSSITRPRMIPMHFLSIREKGF